MWNFLTSFNDIDNRMIVFFMFFGAILAICHSQILSGLYNFKLPRWLFFIVNPLLIGAGFIVYKPLGGGIFLAMIASVFILGIGGILANNAIDTVRWVKAGIKKEGISYFWKIVFSFIIFIALGIAIFFLGHAALFGAFGLFFLYAVLMPTNRSRFLKLQSILPTSTVRSMAMGLVELTGRVQPIKAVTAPMNSKKCVAYHYTVTQESTDKDGHKNYELLESRKECHDFYLEDATAKVLVKSEALEFHWLPEDERRRAGNIIYKQEVLYSNAEVLLIGNANVENEQRVITKDIAHNVFMLAPVASVTKWNVFSPLRRAFMTCLMIIALACAGVLMMLNVDMVDNQLIISWKKNTHLELKTVQD